MQNKRLDRYIKELQTEVLEPMGGSMKVFLRTVFLGLMCVCVCGGFCKQP